VKEIPGQVKVGEQATGVAAEYRVSRQTPSGSGNCNSAWYLVGLLTAGHPSLAFPLDHCAWRRLKINPLWVKN
jgi:hypothetical protein